MKRTGLSFSLVASPQRRFRFARQNHFGTAASAADFRIVHVSGAIESPSSRLV
jgi:hypothetical protein